MQRLSGCGRGRVLNEGSQDALDVYVTAEALDAAGKVLGRGLVFVSGSIPPRGMAPFAISIPAAQNAASFRVRVSSYRQGFGQQVHLWALPNPDPGGMLISPGRRVFRRVTRCHRPWLVAGLRPPQQASEHSRAGAPWLISTPRPIQQFRTTRPRDTFVTRRACDTLSG